jgi:hypothetical protein
MTELRSELLTLPGVRLGEENPLPFFRDAQTNMAVTVLPSLPPKKQEYLGWETGFRVLPYRMQDAYTRQRQPLQFHAVVLENEFLTATFLPELGGRLISLIHRPLQRELLHRNPVFQPANLAIRNAWFSGGIEWNIGQLGHTFTTCAPLFAGAITGPQGDPGLRLYEYERCKGLFWQIDFYLPPGSPFLLAYTRVVNAGAVDVPMYWWTNIAVNEAKDVRVLAPAEHAIHLDFTDQGSAFGYTRLPGLPSLGGKDGTYPLNSTFANEFFFQCDAAAMPWEAALDGKGTGLIELSTPRLAYRKLFVWGSQSGGRHWQEFLSQPGEAYLEIQAGLAPTQLHGLPMAAQSTLDWVQAFGYVAADPAQVHGADWSAAYGAVEHALAGQISAPQLAESEKAYRANADAPIQQLLQTGSGWGALELQRRTSQPAPGEVQPPHGLLFPPETLGAEQQKWLTLLETGRLPDQDPSDLPGEWMVQEDWRSLLESSLHSGAPQTWYGMLHLGVMRMECFDEAGAEAAWQASLSIWPSVWAYRNLAVLRLRQTNTPQAFAYYEQAWDLAVSQGITSAALTIEILKSMVDAGQFLRARAIYQSVPAQVQDVDRIQLLWGQIAMALGDLDSVARVLERDYAIVREGEIVLTDLWFELQARRMAAQTCEQVTPALRLKAKTLFPPPARIDFRMSSEL